MALSAGEKSMSHIDDIMHQAEELGVIKRVDTEETRTVVLVAPLGSVVPDDGILSYSTFDSFSELLNASHGTVILFRPDQKKMLEILSAERETFGLEVKALFGVPGVLYEVWFEEATFGLTKLSYSPLVSEIRMAADVDALKRANEPVSVIEKEERQHRKADGSVRHDQQIGVAREGDDVDSDD